MKVLQICNKPPFPPVDGGCIAMASITEGLIKQGIQVKILSVATSKHPFELNKIPPEYLEKTNFEAVFIDTSIKIWPALKNLLSSQSYNIERFWSDGLAKRLKEILIEEKFDVVHLESLFVAPYIETIRKHTNAPIVLRAHNVEHVIWERLSASSGFPLKKVYLKLLAKRLRVYETKTINQVGGIAAITENDKKKFEEMGCDKPIEVFPVGVDSTRYPISSKKPEFPTIFHLGAMNWEPNIEGVQWFLTEVWPSLSRELPDLKFYIAGRNMPEWMKVLKLDNVFIKPDVPSAIDFINSKAVMVVPMLSGGGMRVKIIEGMALGKTIVSTDIGAEGIDWEDGKNILIANQPHEFVEKLKICFNDPNYCDSIGKAARKLIADNYDNKKICGNLSYFYRQIIDDLS